MESQTPLRLTAVSQAERVGFEPTEPCGSRALQARALGQTMQPLQKDDYIAVGKFHPQAEQL